MGAGGKQNAILTDRIIRGLSEPGIYWDGRVPGFGLRVYPTGKKSWVLVYREWDEEGKIIRGRKVKRTIGGWPGVGADGAAEIARDWHVGVLLRERRWESRGHAKVDSQSPSQSNSQSIPDDCAPSDGPPPPPPPRNYTLGELSAEYQSRHLSRHAGRRHSQDCALRLRSKIIPTLGESTPIEFITRRMIRDAHAHWAETHTPTEANRCLSILRKMFFCALDWGVLSDGRNNPAAGIEMYREGRRERHLSADEIGRLLAAADSEDERSRDIDGWLGAAIRLYLLTGLRKMELLSRRWGDYDRDNKVLWLQTTKAGRPFCLPLSDMAAGILDELRRKSDAGAETRGHPYIFPAAMYIEGARRKVVVPGKHVADFPRRALDRVRAAAGLQDVSIHVLRHTAASILAAGGVSLKLIGGLLNQSTPSITDRYAHLQAEVIRETAEVLAGVVGRCEVGGGIGRGGGGNGGGMDSEGKKPI